MFCDVMWHGMAYKWLVKVFRWKSKFVLFRTFSAPVPLDQPLKPSLLRKDNHVMRENVPKQVEVIVNAPKDEDESIPDDEKKDNPVEMFRRKEPRRSPRLRRRTRELRGGKSRPSELLRIEGSDANVSNTEEGRPVDDKITSYTTQFAMAEDDILSNVAQMTKAPLTLMSQYRPSFEVSDEEDTDDDLDASEEADKKPQGDTGSPKASRKALQTSQKPNDLRRLGLLQKFDPKLRAVLNQEPQKGLVPRSQTLPDMNRPKLTRQPGTEDRSVDQNGSTGSVGPALNSTAARRSALKQTNSAEDRTNQAKENSNVPNVAASLVKEAQMKIQRLNGIHEEAENDATSTPTPDETTLQPALPPETVTPSALRAKSGGKMQWPPVNNRRPSTGEPPAVTKEKEIPKESHPVQQNGVSNNAPEKQTVPVALQGERWWCMYTPKPPLDQILPSYLKTGCIAAR